MWTGGWQARRDGVMMATTRTALYNPVTILGGGRDLADMQDTRDMENTVEYER